MKYEEKRQGITGRRPAVRFPLVIALENEDFPTVISIHRIELQ